jgi:hypothetical protein
MERDRLRLDLLPKSPLANVEELLPDRWAKAHPERVLAHRLEESLHTAWKCRVRRRDIGTGRVRNAGPWAVSLRAKNERSCRRDPAEAL